MTQRPIRIVLIDDEPYSIDELRHLLSTYKDLDIVGDAGSAEEALAKIIELEPDAVFLDIEMGEKNGIELATSLQKLKNVPFVVFATAYPNFAVDAFRVDALDYVLKPFEEEQLLETIKRLRLAFSKQIDQSNNIPYSEDKLAKLAVQHNDTIHYLSPGNIDYIYKDGSVTKVNSVGSEYVTRYSLKEIEEKLINYSFFRTHKGYIVNLKQVEEMTPWFNGAYQLKLKNIHELIPVSRNYVKRLRDRLEL
ncbi:DNA-binding response regulator [Salipaludibacillus keqinensis]|uniref:DNA-binding response regulator n=1 Tax=Salipaludibacillus keqinensis TaxID=2045207 RepID=A0A323T929_9BACI|nr:LytTR family DNA-binding domain-containing protein [Salipaludibacillus keqinensis]PYZ91676.1 DNA-binding response regulator [Salipaludibacillus keqinensis]